MYTSGFAPLDTLSGGLDEGKSYLIYGDVGIGKTTFSLQFLYAGLLLGQRGILVTRRSAETIRDHARTMELDLDRYLNDETLLLFEYAPRVIENCARLKDDLEIVDEFRAQLGPGSVARLVFDPVTPLLHTPTEAMAAFRTRSLFQNLGGWLGGTTLFLLDTPEAEPYLSYAKDFTYGMLRFEADPDEHGIGRMVLERLAGSVGRASILRFTLDSGGLRPIARDVRATKGPEANSRRRVLLVEPNSCERGQLSGILAKDYEIEEVGSAIDALVKAAVDAIDLIVVERHATDFDELWLCRKLRENRINIPIIVVSWRLRRARDRAAILAAGADACIEKPVDARILRLEARNLLARFDRDDDRLSHWPIETAAIDVAARAGTAATTNLAYFHGRIREETDNSQRHGLTFGVVKVRPDEDVWHETLLRIEAAIREYDLVFSSSRGMAILLAETNEEGVRLFLNRLLGPWAQTAIKSEYRCFDSSEGVFDLVREFVDDLADPNVANVPETAARA